MKILIVDDEPLVRKSLSRACRAKGHEVVEAADGIEGLTLWIKHQPDLAFVDVLMPGLSGPELLAEISKRKNELKRTRVILMSAYSGEHNPAREAELFIPKPFDDVFEVVKQAEDLYART